MIRLTFSPYGVLFRAERVPLLLHELADLVLLLCGQRQLTLVKQSTEQLASVDLLLKKLFADVDCLAVLFTDILVIDWVQNGVSFLIGLFAFLWDLFEHAVYADVHGLRSV